MKKSTYSIIRNLDVGEAVILPASKKGYVRSLISHKTLEQNLQNENKRRHNDCIKNKMKKAKRRIKSKNKDVAKLLYYLRIHHIDYRLFGRGHL